MDERPTIIHIKPGTSSLLIDPQEYWRARYMFLMLIRKKVRASFGEMYFWFVWVCARPLIYVLIFALFKHWSEAKTGVEIPYVLFVYSGLILWYYFMETAIDVASNIRANAALVSKIYIPSLLTPSVPPVANLVDLAISSAPLVVMMIYFSVYPGWHFLMLVPTLLIVMMMALGVGLLIATITLKLRDFQKILEFLLYVGMFASPVIFSPLMIPESVRPYYYLNPMVGPLLAWRSTLFDLIYFPWQLWLYSCGVGCFVLAVGYYAYRKHEHEMVEAI